MAHWQGKILDTTPLKNTKHGGDDLSLSELSTTPQFRWMGDVGQETPVSHSRPNPYTPSDVGSRSGLSLEQDYSGEDLSHQIPADESYSYREGTSATSALVDDEGEGEGTAEEEVEGDQTQIQIDRKGVDSNASDNANAKERELDGLVYGLKQMNQGIVRLNSVLRSTIPKFQRMQRAIDAWDAISKDYNRILYETERTAQVLEDPSWPGRDVEEIRHRQMKAAEADRKREEERRREIEARLREEERLERERREKEEAERKAKGGSSLSGRGRGSIVRGTGVPGRIGRGSTTTRGITRGSGIGRGSIGSHRSTASVSSQSSIPAPGSYRGRYS